MSDTTINTDEIKALVTTALTTALAPVVETITTAVVEQVKDLTRPELPEGVESLLGQALESVSAAEDEIGTLKSVIEDWEYKASQLESDIDSYTASDAEGSIEEARAKVAEVAEQFGL
jgi:hypothetical protein